MQSNDLLHSFDMEPSYQRPEKVDKKKLQVVHYANEEVNII